MHSLRGTMWGPRPLPELLKTQLASDGFEPTEAAACAQRISESPTPTSAAPLFVTLGACKFLEGDIDGAVASWRHAITGGHEPAASRALLNLGLLYEHLHLNDRALSVLDATAERGVAPHAEDAVMAAARVRRELGDIDAAMDSMARLTQSIMATPAADQDLAETLYGFGELAFDAGRFDRAERAWRAAAASPASSAQGAAKERLVALLIDAGRDEELADLFDEESISGASVDVAVVLDRAEALERSGDRQGAGELARTVVLGAATDTDRFRLADVRSRLGLINEAIDELEPMLVSAHADVRQRAAFVLGEIYQDYDMVDAAVSMFERAVSQPDDFWSRKAAISLGDIHSERRQREQALEHWTFASVSPVGALRSLATERLELAFSDPAEPEIGRLDEFDGDDAVEAAAIEELEPAIVLLDDDVESPLVMPLDASEPQVVLLGDLEDVESPVVAPLGAAEPQVMLLGDLEDDTASGLPSFVEPLEGTPPQVLVLDDLAEVDIDITDTDIADTNAYAAAPTPVAEVVPSHVVVLDELESQDLLPPAIEPAPEIIIEPAASEVPVAASTPVTEVDPPQATASAFRSLSNANPYAALAPEANDDDPAPSSRNPYAELAPNYDDTEVPEGVQPGDWEALLDGWPADDVAASSVPEPSGGDTKPPSAFSRYT